MNLRLRIFIFNLVTVATAFSLIILIGYKILESTVIENTYEKLNLIRIEKAKSIENYFRDIITGSDLIATNSMALELLSGHRPAEGNIDLRHIDEYARSFNLLDLLLIKSDGTVVYTTNREIDPGAKVSEGGHALGKIPDLYAWGMKAAHGNFLLLDFDYDDSNSKQAISYLASPVFQGDRRLGVLVFRISINQIDQITSDNYAWSLHGLGNTGETLIYGEDWSLRNTSRFAIERNEDMALQTRAGIFATNRGDEDFNKLNEFDELQERGKDYRGVTVFRSIGKLYLPNGDNWFIQVKMDESEAFAVFRKLLVAAATAAFIITIIFFLLSYAATRQVIQPILLLIERLEKLGTDNLSQKINYKSKDEIGTLVSKYNQLADRLEKTTVSKEFVDSVIASLKEYLFIVRVDKTLPPNRAPYRILQANDSALEALSLSGYEIQDRDLREMILATPSFDSHTWLLNNRHSIEADLLTPAGKKIPVLVNWSLLPEQRSHDLIFVFACTDITETRANELALIRAREEAISASMAKSEFLARMSHEIRTPLNAMIGMTEVLSDSGLSSEQKNMLQISSNAGENLLAIINDILDLSKIEARQVVIEKIPFNLFEVTKNVCEILSQKAKDKNLDLNLKLFVSEDTVVIGDPTRIRQILLNLVGNAIKFTEKGSVEVELRHEDSVYDFFVRDSGLGIPEEKRHLIFKNFSQADSSITRKYGGTGLGLAICKNLVELMGGHIDFHSSPGNGSTFFFSLPLTTAEKESADAARKKSSSPERILHIKRPLKILVVDDTEDNRFLIRAYLKKHPCEIVDAANGEEAVELSQKYNFDLIFMDVQMPVMDGYAATRKIRELERKSSKAACLVVALSANALNEDIRNSIEAGCNDYLPKPIKKDILYQLLEKYFS